MKPDRLPSCWKRLVAAFATLTACALLLVPAGSAGAATRIGTTFEPTGSFSAFQTVIQSTSPGGLYAAPSAGVITSWSYQASASNVPQGLKLKIARPAPGADLTMDADFTIVGESTPKNPTASTLNTFTDVQIPVQAGDLIGLYTGSVASVRLGDFPVGYAEHDFPTDADVPPGFTGTFEGPFGPTRFDVSATLEPDCDGDALGDETQDLDLTGGSCPVGNRSLTLDASKSKVKKGKEITLSGQVVGTGKHFSCQSGQTVELQRRKSGKGAFATFDRVATFAAGNFSTDETVKKTFEYRAQIAATGTCPNVVSGSEKVKVKKPK